MSERWKAFMQRLNGSEPVAVEAEPPKVAERNQTLYFRTALMERQRFVYGSFTWPGNENPDPVSLEIVQEHGSNELIAKIYFKGVREWVPLEPGKLVNAEWFKYYATLPAPTKSNSRRFYFDMEGSGHWTVLHFRTESADNTTYVAAALKFTE